VGVASASVFVNTDSEKRSFRTVSLQRRYKDGDSWKTSTSFTLAQLPAAVAVLQLAMHHIAAQDDADADD
jgi:hypothetical protein